jgi:hypothetical protein
MALCRHLFRLVPVGRLGPTRSGVRAHCFTAAEFVNGVRWPSDCLPVGLCHPVGPSLWQQRCSVPSDRVPGSKRIIFLYYRLWCAFVLDILMCRCISGNARHSGLSFLSVFQITWPYQGGVFVWSPCLHSFFGTSSKVFKTVSDFRRVTRTSCQLQAVLGVCCYSLLASLHFDSNPVAMRRPLWDVRKLSCESPKGVHSSRKLLISCLTLAAATPAQPSASLAQLPVMWRVPGAVPPPALLAHDGALLIPDEHNGRRPGFTWLDFPSSFTSFGFLFTWALLPVALCAGADGSIGRSPCHCCLLIVLTQHC